jgi:hypothetical protein
LAENDPEYPQKEPDNAPSDSADSVPVTIERVVEILEKGDVTVEHGAIRWSSNYTFLLSMTYEDITVPCVYKPRSGERPLWDFPDGTLAQRERASFLTSEALGWQIVPPTVLRVGPRGIGSMQFFVEHDPEYHYFSFDESLRPQLARLVLFDCIVNNADRKGGHCIVDAQDHLWGIDQGLTFNVAHKLRTVVWDFAGQTIAENLMQDLERLCEQVGTRSHAFRTSLDELLSANEITAFERRIERLLKSGRYPRPGPGPNYPWPPV